mmetsp:Transcript_2462/g.8788  ORF Transcript_2462/g.8788 Transcript_2462/m.8788 type:complete len:109 (-) Transcript_2462:694-1020(-)
MSRHRRPLDPKARRTRTKADVREETARARGRSDVQVDKLRDMFEKNRNVTDPNLIDELIEQGEKKLHAGRHPDPYVVPYYVGGTKYARNPPVPPEMRLVFDYGREVQP